MMDQSTYTSRSSVFPWGIRFILLSGKPLKEPIAWGGPVVMNTKEELDQAFKELDEGNFIKKQIEEAVSKQKNNRLDIII